MVFGDTAGSWRVKMCGMVFWMLIWKVQMKSPDSWFRKLHIKAVSHIFHIRWVLMQRGYTKSFHPVLWPRSTLWTRRRWTPHPRKGLGDFDSRFSKQSLVFAANRNLEILEWNKFFFEGWCQVLLLCGQEDSKIPFNFISKTKSLWGTVKGFLVELVWYIQISVLDSILDRFGQGSLVLYVSKCSPASFHLYV